MRIVLPFLFCLPALLAADKVELFNGVNMDGWLGPDNQPARCTVANREISCSSGVGDIHTKAPHGSAHLHVEFQIPAMPAQKGQLKGNSGVYLHGRYEIQILDSWENPTYANGSLGALYGQSAPMLNAARQPLEWQSYDIIFHATVCDAAGAVTNKATVTVLLNGELVQDHVTIEKATECTVGPLLLQDHSGFKDAPKTTMKFRNLWLRPL